MRLSHQTKNAVKVLVFCARNPDQTFTVSDIAANCGITEYNAFKLVPILVRAEILTSIRGRNGGIRLAREPDEISVGAVVRATEERLSRHAGDACGREGKDGKDGKAGKNDMGFDDMVDDAMLAFVEILDKNTIADLTGSEFSGESGIAKRSGQATGARDQTST